MLGNEAIARGAIEAGVRFVACYPGTPSSEVVEHLLAMRAACDGHPDLKIEYSINEKVALESACGAALAGSPGMAVMKHVGLNVAADPLFTAAYIGMPGGLVVLTADDPGCHSSQNEQDNRNYARAAHLPCFEPASPEEARAMTPAAFALSAELELPVLLRTTTRISHMRGPVYRGGCVCSQKECRPEASRCVPVPAVARVRRRALAELMGRAATLSESSPFNQVKNASPTGRKYGIIASGVARAYLADALKSAGWEQDADILELGMTWPLPEKMLRDFIDRHSHILVLEEGEPLLEKEVRALAADAKARVEGKSEGLSAIGEYSATAVLARLALWLDREHEPQQGQNLQPGGLPSRPPNLCPGCAHRSVYYAVKKVFGDDAIYSSDIGCYTLGLLPPLKTADFLVCMGSSITAGSGYSRASGKTVVGFIGDSTFFHSGMSGLANAVFNKHDILVVILDNGTTAMTGHQPNPGMVQERLGADAIHLDIEAIVAGLGITQFRSVKANNLGATMGALKELKEMEGVRVLLAREPCALYARQTLNKKKGPVACVLRQGPEAEKCLAEFACPAFTRRGRELAVDPGLCTSCMMCVQIAPGSFGTVKRSDQAEASAQA